MNFFSKVIFICSFLAVSINISGQAFDNWVKYDQPYFKIKITEDGIHKVNYLDLSLQAIELQLPSTIPTNNLQMFHMGKEIPIHIKGGEDGVFFHGDYILFYGVKNQGALDEALYEKKEEMANPYYSLFTDTGVYYLTYKPGSNAKVGLRFQLQTTFDAGAPYLKSYEHEEVVNFNNMYSYGKPYSIFSENFHYSEYKEGEGWIGPRFGYNQGLAKRIEAVTTNAVDRTSPSNAELQFNIIGLSNDNFVYLDHAVEVGIAPDISSFTRVFDTIFEGYTNINKTIEVPLSNVGDVFYLFRILAKKSIECQCSW